MPLERIGDLIEGTMQGIQEQMKELSRVHSQLQTWRAAYLEDDLKKMTEGLREYAAHDACSENREFLNMARCRL